MRILQVEKTYFPQGGAPKYALELSGLLQSAGHEVIPFSVFHEKNLASPYAQFFPKTFDFSDVKNASFGKKIAAAATIFYSREAKQKMEKLLDQETIDVAHLHNIYHQISPSILPVLKKRSIPVVMTLHDYKLLSPNYTMFHHGAVHEEDARGWYGSCVINKGFKNSRLLSALVTAEMIFHHKFKKYYERSVDVYLAPSLFIRDLFIKHGFPADKIVHLPLPTMATAGPVVKPGAYVAYVGRLSEEKGLRVLLSAAEMTPDIKYVIVGAGPEETMLKTIITKDHLSNVQLVGFKQGDELKSILAGARLLVAPSIWYENYPLSILEAKAAGKVVIGSMIGGIPELLPRDLLVQPNNPTSLAGAISTWFIKKNTDLVEKGIVLQKEARLANDPKNHLEKIVEVYNQVIGR